MVTLLPCMAIRFTMPNIRTRKSSLASCRASSAVDCILYERSFQMPHTTSRTKRWNGSFLISNSVLFWYRVISRNATVPGLNRRCLRTRPFAGPFPGFPPMSFRAVCAFVRPIAVIDYKRNIVVTNNQQHGLIVELWNYTIIDCRLTCDALTVTARVVLRCLRSLLIMLV